MADLIARVYDEIQPKKLRRNAELRRVMRRINSGEELSEEDWTAIGRDYLRLLMALPDLVSRLLERGDLAAEAGSRAYVATVLENIMGTDGTPHIELFKRFLTTVEVDLGRIADTSASAEVTALFNGLDAIYTDEASSVARALGGLAAFEILGTEVVRNLGWGCGLRIRRRQSRSWLLRRTPLGRDETPRGHAADGTRLRDQRDQRRRLSVWSRVGRRADPGVLDQTMDAGIQSASTAGNRISLVERSGGAAERLGAPRYLPPGDRLSGGSYFFFSETDIASGANWEQVIKEVARSALAGVIVLTPESATSPWVNYEAGLLSVSGADRQHEHLQRFPLHVLVVSSDPRGLLEQHPLQSLQMVSSQQPRALIEAIWTLLADHHATVQAPTPQRIDAVADLLKERLKPWEFEADKALARRPSARARWTEYLLSLGTPRLNVPSPDPVHHLPADLRDAEDVLRVIESLVESYLGGQIDHGDRVYLAVQVDEDILMRANRGRFLYRILFVAGGAFDELNWHENALVGPHSTIHQAHVSKKAQLAKRSDEHNAPVAGEAQVACAPIRLDSRVVAVLGISSNEDARTLRIENLLSRFSQMLEFFLTIVAARVRRGDLMLSTNVDERAGYRALTDDDISLTIWKMLANHRLSELFRSDDERILDTDLLIRNSFR